MKYFTFTQLKEKHHLQGDNTYCGYCIKYLGYKKTRRYVDRIKTVVYYKDNHSI